jgi:phage terminase large subunit
LQGISDQIDRLMGVAAVPRTKSRLDTLAGLGIEANVVPQSNVLDGINVVRRMLGRTWIDANRCERAIEALRQYRREYDDRLKDWKKSALHDWTSHCCDAARTFACGFDDTPAIRVGGAGKASPRLEVRCGRHSQRPLAARHCGYAIQSRQMSLNGSGDMAV